jgi:ketosteroid isomerase-like protein
MSHFEPGSVRLEITGMIAEGDAVALQWTSRGRLLGGARYENRCIGVFTVRDGRIRSVDEYMDTHYAHRAFAAAAVARDGLAAPAS